MSPHPSLGKEFLLFGKEFLWFRRFLILFCCVLYPLEQHVAQSLSADFISDALKGICPDYHFDCLKQTGPAWHLALMIFHLILHGVIFYSLFYRQEIESRIVEWGISAFVFVLMLVFGLEAYYLHRFLFFMMNRFGGDLGLWLGGGLLFVFVINILFIWFKCYDQAKNVIFGASPP